MKDGIRDKTIVVWFSCGAASAVAAKKTIELYASEYNIRVVNNPVKEEHEDNQRFLKDVEKWLGIEIEVCVNPKFPDASCETVWDKRKYMSGVYGAPCTLELKKNARKYWEANNKHDFLVLGFTSEEEKRAKRFKQTERTNLLTPLIDLELSKKDCFDIIMDAGLELPEIYKLGYPNANCIGCVKSASVTYWNHVRVQHPEVFKKRAEMSREVGCRLIKYKGERIFLDELDPNAKGRNMKNLQFECGIFCEEKP